MWIKSAKESTLPKLVGHAYRPIFYISSLIQHLASWHCHHILSRVRLPNYQSLLLRPFVRLNELLAALALIERNSLRHRCPQWLGLVESLPLRINSVSPYTISDDIKLKQPDSFDLKEQLEDETGVRKEKIKLVGIKCKKEFRDINNNKITDQTLVHQLELKSKKKGFIMIGTLDKNAFKVQFLFIPCECTECYGFWNKKPTVE